MAITSIDSKWKRNVLVDDSDIEDSFTFCGILEDRYHKISRNWNKDTCLKNENSYNQIILPALKDQDNKLISDYTKEDYEEAIDLIIKNGYIKNNKKCEYSESSIRNFKRLIYYVVHYASVYGYCDNVLWGSTFALDISDETAEINARVLSKKSLSVKQETMLSKEIMTDINEDGASVALLLMWGLGLRNAEACGLNYGDLREIEGHPECQVAWIYKTTKIDSNELQSGGKTYNTGRIIPVPSKIIGFLYKRRKVIEDIIQKQGKNIEINDLPICCNGSLSTDSEAYTIRCKADHVTSIAHSIFESVGITSSQVAYLDEEIHRKNDFYINEKEPTAYLLRRNFATQMCILGLSTAEMQYLIGHNVEDAYEARNEYVDSDRIYLMYKKLSKRAILNDPEYESSQEAKVHLASNSIAKICISAKEPGDNIELNIIHKGNSTSEIMESEKVGEYTRIIDIESDYRKTYIK